MADVNKATLVKLSDSDMMLDDPAADIRGRKVRDREDEEIGHVDDLLIDDTDKKVRFLQVAAGGFLGLGERKFMIPVDAITRIDDKHVHVDQTREHIVGAPDYDPEVVPEEHYWNDLYSHYGYEPYWAGGYMYPAYPYYL